MILKINVLEIGCDCGGTLFEFKKHFKKAELYGVDINEDYLCKVDKRYPLLQGVLKCLKIDLINEADKLPEAQLVIANLLIEYIGYPAFQKAVQKIDPEYVSCVIQINTDTKQWVSDSPYLHAFDRLDEVHHQMEEDALEKAMKEIGYSLIHRSIETLPNGKALVRMDFSR